MSTHPDSTPQASAEAPDKGVVCDALVSPSGIWTVATIGIHGGRDVEARTWGYYFTEADAIAGMRRCCDIEAGYYTHAIIENFTPGIYATANKETWFFWDDGWKPCAKPESESHVVNYGMG